MKKVIINVDGGVVEIERNDGVNIGIIDYDLEEYERDEITGDEDVIIEVYGGVADVTKCPDNVEVEIIDNDTLD